MHHPPPVQFLLQHKILGMDKAEIVHDIGDTLNTPIYLGVEYNLTRSPVKIELDYYDISILGFNSGSIHLIISNISLFVIATHPAV